MGFVYEAEHLLLKRKAALKTLAPGARRRQRLPRALRPRVADGRLDRPPEHHPDLRRRATTTGLVYIAMRYVNGPDLEQLIEEGGTHDPHEALVDPRAGRRRARRRARARDRSTAT